MISIHPPDYTAKDLLALLHKREDMCDIAIMVGTDRVLAHSCVLASQSSIIASILKARLEDQCDWSSLMPLCIAFDDIVMDASKINTGHSDSKKVLELLVSFMYGQSITSTKSELDSMIWYGKLLGITDCLYNTLLVATNYSQDDLITEEMQVIFDKNVENDIENFKLDTTLEEIKLANSLSSDNLLTTAISQEVNTNQLNLDSALLQFIPDTNVEKDLSSYITEEINTDCITSIKEPSTSGETICNSIKCDVYKQPSKSTGKNHICNICRCTFQKCCDLVKHVINDQHYSHNCPVCLIHIDDSQEQRIHFSHHNHILPFFCPHCELRFRTRAALTMHTPKHSNSKPYICEECGRAFKWRHSLQAHLLTHKNHCHLLCEICGFSSNYAYTFKAHLQQHTGQEYPFQCPQPGCTFKSYRKTHLKDHLTSHSKVRPHQCEVCGRSFSQAKNLRRHMRLHTPDTSLLECQAISNPRCEFRTTRLDKLRNHMAKKHDLDSQSIKLTTSKQLKQSTMTPDVSHRLPYMTISNDIPPSNNQISFDITNTNDIKMSDSLVL